MVADIWDCLLQLAKVAAGLCKGLFTHAHFVRFSFRRVECQVRLLIPDWISFESADTPAKACSSALNALVLTAALQAGSHVLGHGYHIRSRSPALQSYRHPRKHRKQKSSV